MGGSANRMKGSWTVRQTGGEKPGLGEAWSLCLSDEKGLGRRWTIVRSAFPPPQFSPAWEGKWGGALSPGDPLYRQLFAAEMDLFNPQLPAPSLV